jgi:methylmalonyl-CoA/ethylmalonyl-CoA epimerase
MIQSLHHIGIAVDDLDEAVRLYRDVLGLSFHGIEDVPTEGVRVAVVQAGPVRIELLQALQPDSPIAKFVGKRGPGIHHLAFQVDSCQGTLEVLRSKGAPVIDQTPRPGAHGTKVAFIHPKGLKGVLAELVEDPHGR